TKYRNKHKHNSSKKPDSFNNKELNDQAFGMAAIMGLDPPLFSICHILSPL
ncbi:24519_t:CDS:1, partial [Entrophospora sp. SA101]